MESRCNWSFEKICRYHHLKLYPEDESGPQSTKKPVVMESYNEIVFPDPSEGFLARVQNHPSLVLPRLPAGLTLPSPGNFSVWLSLSFGSHSALNNYFLDFAVPNENTNEKERGDTKDHHLAQWFTNFSEADELLKLAAARQQVKLVSLSLCSLTIYLVLKHFNHVTWSNNSPSRSFT